MVPMETINLLKYKGSRKMLETLMKYPRRTFTINELAKEAGVPFASAWRLIRRFEPAGIIETGKVGKSITVKLGHSGYVQQVMAILRMSTSPQRFTANEIKAAIAEEKAIKKAYLFGSVAESSEKLTSDIDIAILARPDFLPDKLIYEIYDRYGTKVVPLMFQDEAEFEAFIKDKKTERLK